jgi:serine/threonine protein kinase
MMTALDKNRRLKCKQILAKKHFWYLNPFDSSLKGFINESLTLSSTEKSFSQHFIQQKFKYYSKNFEESYNQEMKKNKYNQEFEEMEEISIGSYGIVCKAKNKKSCEIFAVKKIPFNEELRDLVMKEIESLANLKSALVVKLESVWIEDNYLKILIDYYKTDKCTESIGKPEIFKPNKSLLLHIQMEFCLMTLRVVINKLNNELNQYQSEVMTPLGYYISSQLFEEILESVDYLHKQKVIHRDLKPNNILITNGMNGRFVKIADFGLATIHEFEGQLRTKYMETIKYVAPEVMRTRNYDLKVDIYSLGVILQELFNIDINEYLNIFFIFHFHYF